MSDPGDLLHSAFYRFAALLDPQSFAVAVKEISKELCGSILIASEGINGMVAGTRKQLDTFEHDLCELHEGTLKGMPFNRSECTTPPFKHMRVKVKREIVALGVTGVNAINRPRQALSPRAWRDLIAQDDVIVIDNRNSFEFKLGHFQGAVDPGIAHFRDFPTYMQKNVPEWQTQGKKVAMYCTGGIRCEKTSAWMLDQGVEVYELDGGILNYFAQMPDAEKDWQGECFVFDNRVAINTKLQETDTPVEDVYKDEPDGQWRINRARRLAGDLDEGGDSEI